MMKPPLVDLCPPYNKSDKQTYERFSRKRVLIPPVTFVGTLNTTTKIVLGKVILNPKMSGKTQYLGEDPGSNVQIVMSLVISLATLLKLVWHTLLTAVCELDFQERKKHISHP